MEHTETNELKNFWILVQCVLASILRRWKFILCTALLLGMITDMTRTVLYHPQYSSSMQAVMQTEENTYADLEGTKTYIRTLEYILNGQMAKSYVRETLGKPGLPVQCRIVSQEDTNLVTISVVSDSRQNSYYALQALLDWYGERSGDLDQQHTLKVRSEVRFSERPLTANSHKHNFVLGAGISGVLIAAIAVFLDALRKTVRSAEEVERSLGCRLLAKIPKETKRRGRTFWKRSKQAILISSVKTSPAYRQAIEKLRHKLEASARKHGYRTLLVTSASENEGKSSVVANLAISLGRKQRKVLLIDCDLLQPAVHKIFEQSNQRQNLNRYLVGKRGWQEQVQVLERENISVITARAEASTEELLESDRLETLLKEAQQEYDYVILDSPPVGSLNDAIRLNQMVDASLLVVRQDTATCGLINETIARMSVAKNNLVGCVYNARYAEKLAGGRSGYRAYESYGRGR